MLIVWGASCEQCGPVPGRHVDADAALNALRAHWMVTGHRTGLLGMTAEDIDQRVRSEQFWRVSRRHSAPLQLSALPRRMALHWLP